MMRWRRQPSSRLLLHVGRHKTGSTSLQQALAHATLKPFGILYPQIGRQGDQHAAFPAALLNLAAADVQQPGFEREAQRCLAPLLEGLEQECQVARPTLILLSSEVFCELAKRRPQHCLWLLEQLASRWPLQLLQVVRPLPEYFLSALKHQLREATFVHRSPFSWYRHCRQKSQLLDSFWLYSGYTLTTLFYSQQDSARLVFEAAAESAGLRNRSKERLLAQLPRLRANQSHRNSGLYATYFLYLVRARAWQAAPPPKMPALEILSQAEFAARISTADPNLLPGISSCLVRDGDLLLLCQKRDEELDSGLVTAVDPLLGDGPVDRSADWNFIRSSEFYRALRIPFAQICSLLLLPDPEV